MAIVSALKLYWLKEFSTKASHNTPSLLAFFVKIIFEELKKLRQKGIFTEDWLVSAHKDCQIILEQAEKNRD